VAVRSNVEAVKFGNWRCYRSMIADYFKVREWEVLHILGLGDAKEHPDTSVARIVHGRLNALTLPPSLRPPSSRVP
jgi:uncharacterized protein (DUF488 family)